MEDNIIREPEMGLTFEKVWAMFQETNLKFRETGRKLEETALQIKEMVKETDRQIKEMSDKTDRQIREMSEKTDRQIKERSEKTDRKLAETAQQIKEMAKEWDLQMKESARQIKENNRLIGNLGGRMGDLVEHLVIPNILEKFNQRGFGFGKAGPHIRYHGPDGNYLAEVDILLENGDTMLAVEVKTSLTKQDVMDHIERMKKLRCYGDERNDTRKLLGAVAGAIASQEAKAFALKNGFFVLEQAGDTMRINVPDGFKPRVW
jgi:hypothetical protein